jgi:hypothetical protein
MNVQRAVEIQGHGEKNWSSMFRSALRRTKLAIDFRAKGWLAEYRG